MDNKHIIMSQKEVSRYDIIKKAIEKEIKGTEAANILNLTTRHIRRLKKKVGKEGIQGLAHASRGKPSNRRMPAEEKEKIKQLISKHYPDFGPTFAAEKLEEIHKIKRDPKTVRAIMIEEDIWKPKIKQKQEYRSWRQRRTALGELEQYDGSYEYWFEDRGKKCCLLASIDDATSKITHAKFDEHEGVAPTFNFWQEYFEINGKPNEIYVDKFSTYSMNHNLAKENADTLTQFQRAMRQLNVGVINAHSSQAKGRVERLFGTLQDRLIKELRINNISTISEANEFLEKTFIPKFNGKFSVAARSNANLHKKITKREKDKFPSIFSRHYERTIRNDYTLSYKNIWYQLEETQSVAMFKNETVTVEERFDGSIYFRLRGKHLNYKQLPERPMKVSDKSIPWVLVKPLPARPAADHPWRKFQYAKN
jgi:transposase-like protein